MNKVCLGCGVELQTISKEEKGYIPENKYNDSVYCQRCFRLTHYGEVSNDQKPYTEEELINKINDKPLFTIFLIDLLNITDRVINFYKQITNPKVLIVNKCEILPLFVKREKLIDYLKDKFDIDNIIIKGYKKEREANKVLKFLEKNAVKESYLVGLSNSGKSTLINDLLELTNSDSAKLTVSKETNTTLDFLSIKVSSSLTLIDTPGFLLEPLINIKRSKKISSYIFQMKENDTLNLTDDIYLNTKAKCNINYFTDLANERVIKKNYKKDLTYETELKINKNEDLIIYGLGFINFKQDTIIKINLSDEYLSIRKSFFGGHHE